MKRLKILLQSKIFFIVSLGFLAFYVVFFTKIVSYSSVYRLKDNLFIGILTHYKIDGDKLSFTLKAKEKLQGSYYFKNVDEKNKFLNEIKLGQTLEIKGILMSPSSNTIPNTFNYKEYLFNKKIYWLLSAEKIVIKDNKVPILYNFKNLFISRINLFKYTSSYMYAFVLGDNGYIDNDVYTDFQKNGVTHLFAVSGMHIGLFIIVINSILKKVKLKDNTISYFTIIFFLFYLFLVGFSASVVRATIFYMLLFFNKKFNWNFKNIKLFYFLFFSLLVVNPFYIYDVGFIYSFLTSFGLMTFSKKLNGNYFKKLFKTSLIAFLFSLPVTIYFNYEFNVLTIFNNLIIVPIISLFLFPFSLITFIFPFLEVFLQGGFSILESINSFLSAFALNFVVGKVSIIFIILYYLIVFMGYKKTCFYSGILLLIVGAKYKYYFDSNSYIYYLDVGQGDATFIVSENRDDIILIDSGGAFEFEKKDWQIRNSNFNLANNIVQFIKSLGIAKIDLFVATHGDKDHIGYMIDILKKIKVDKVILNNNKYNKDENKILDMVPLQLKNEYVGKKIYLKNLNCTLSSDENESSLVLYIVLDNKEILIMGDAPKKVEKDIIKKYSLNIDILKVGHHGSNTSSDLDFLKNIKPKLAIISAGRNNRYNHPSIETINNLKTCNIKYYNTQESGTIMLEIKDGKYFLKAYPPYE